jgi:hypothetical protein
MPYHLEGRFIEACDCSTICPCWIDAEPDEDECTGLFVWEITAGSVEGVPMAGLNAASVSFHTGKRTGSKQRVALFIDKRASAEQAPLLEEVFSGQHGGTLAELGQMLGDLSAVVSARVDISWDEEGPTVEIGTYATLRSRTIHGATGRPITLVDSALARVLGSPAQIGSSKTFELDVASADLELSVKGRSVTHGLFNYAG